MSDYQVANTANLFDFDTNEFVGVIGPDGKEKMLPGGSGTLGPVVVSRTALASDGGATLELGSGVTYTLDSAVALPAGVVLVGPSSGSATIAAAGSATINGGTSSVTISAGQIYSAIPRASNASAYVVKGS